MSKYGIAKVVIANCYKTITDFSLIEPIAFNSVFVSTLIENQVEISRFSV